MGHVLIVPSFYPTPQKPLNGTFFRDHVHTMRDADWTVGVTYAETRSLRQFSLRGLLTSHFQVSESLEEGIRTLRLHSWNPGAQTYAGGKTWGRLCARLIKEYVRRVGRPDVIHAHNALWAGEAARMASADNGIPYLITEHSSQILSRELTPRQRTAATRVYLEASGVSTVSQRLGDVVNEFSRREVTIIPNPIDTNFFTQPPSARFDFDGRRFVTVANLNANKRVDLLLRAFVLVVHENPRSGLVIVGDGPTRIQLERLASELGISHSVHFAGAAGRIAVRDALWNSSCFVSTSDCETFGMAVAEALSTGLAVVATRSGGPEEILGGGLGVLVDAGDEAGLARAMCAVDRPTVEERAERRKAIIARYSRQVVSRCYDQFYRRALQESRAHVP
jgi:glycosyltransferase involved in cell wall biosynthesis